MSIKVTSRVWDHSRQRNSRLLLILALADFAHDSGVCWAQGLTLRTIANKSRVNERQARNLIAQIAAEGELYAPPAVGRGNTTRYFVTTGLSAAEIALVLVHEFELPTSQAATVAADLLQRQHHGAHPTEQGADMPPQSTIKAPKKGYSPAAFSPRKTGNLAPENRQSSAENRQSSAENRQSSAEKPAIQRSDVEQRSASEPAKTPLPSADPSMIRNDPSHDPSSSPHEQQKEKEEITSTEQLLLSVGLYPSSAYALRDLPYAAVEAYVRKRKQQNWSAGAIKQGLERERAQLSGQPQATKSDTPSPDWLAKAREICSPETLPEDVETAAAWLSQGSPPAETVRLLARLVARRANTGGSHVTA